MVNKSMGEIISSLRKEKGMTQNDLAKKMNVTDKAVSKWERNLSCPDINSLPRLSEILGTTIEELLNAEPKKERHKMDQIIDTALIGIGLAMGICILTASILRQIETADALAMSGIGMSCFAVYLLKNKSSKQ